MSITGEVWRTRVGLAYHQNPIPNTVRGRRMADCESRDTVVGCLCRAGAVLRKIEAICANHTGIGMEIEDSRVPLGWLRRNLNHARCRAGTGQVAVRGRFGVGEVARSSYESAGFSSKEFGTPGRIGGVSVYGIAGRCRDRR